MCDGFYIEKVGQKEVSIEGRELNVKTFLKGFYVLSDAVSTHGCNSYKLNGR